MDYENCGEGGVNSVRKFPLAFAIVVAIVVILVYIYAFGSPLEGLIGGHSEDEIMMALDVTMKEKGTIVDFKKTLKDSSFSPTKYIHLADLYRNGKLTKAAVTKTMEDSSI